MIGQIDIRVDVDDRQVRARLEAIPPRLQRDLVAPVQRWAGRALGLVQSSEPASRSSSDDTKGLRAETRQFVDVRDGYVRGRVRVLNEDGRKNLKAAALEYGSHRSVRVRAHNMNLGHFWDRPGFADVSVPSYSRVTNITALRFLRQAMQATREEAKTDIEATINQSIR